MVEVVKLNSEEAIEYFPVVLPYIKRAVDQSQGEYGVGDYLDYLGNGVFDLWVIVKDNEVIGAGVTAIVHHPQYNVCVIRLLSTDVGTGLETITTKTIERWAKVNGCKRLEMYGRKGWLKVLNKYGWKQSPYTVMEKEI